MTHSTNTPLFWAPQAWIDGQWQQQVCLEVQANGHWGQISTGIHPAPQQATLLPGPVLPGLVNAHSHAFQRAFAGLAERRSAETDDFWSWRDRMYGVALRITPAQMQAVAAQLYREMLQGGYTQVCEFHYLHHQPDGTAYSDPARMAWAVADGAAAAGLGLTLLPVLYQRAGFSQPQLRPDQRRFATTPGWIAELQQAIASAQRPLVNAGIAIHSLRAAAPDSMAQLLAWVQKQDMPIHIHIAEQMQEVRDCLASTGKRPIEWLSDTLPLDARWQLVHATHAQASEIEAVARSGAGIVLCPSTEGNLGDGFADLPHWLKTGVPLSIGSDSHVCRQWNEELRWLEYGQRLLLQQRNVSAHPASGGGGGVDGGGGGVDGGGGGGGGGGGEGSTAARLFAAALHGGGQAAGQPRWGLQPGARADLLVLDTQANGLLGVPTSHLLDAFVFASDTPAIRDVYVAGQQVITNGRHIRQAAIAAGFEAAMGGIWGG